ncbi:hypothetical protein EJ06DRAFT_562046 [Trichodelitschia bisporula]|uniref:Uncharacterized protein n=1 Tax=Trichodelitschia bisporula TaxID=703511 RepID=A0A6G1HUL3_9PEZI|nr:hypothetical protein EJ06DRAFT_562046 [Trichodelitschia bisporula]
MRPQTLALLAALASATPITNEKRQIGGLGALSAGLMDPKTIGQLANLVQPTKVEALPAKVRKGAKRQRLIWGPFDFVAGNATVPGMPGIQMDPHGQVTMRRLGGFCTDCTVIHGAAYVANADGGRVDVKEGAYLHHLLILNPTKRVPSYYTCSANGGAPVSQTVPSSYFLGSGVDESEYFFTTPDGTYNSGYYVGSRDGFMMQSEIVNYNPEARRWYIAAEYEYELGKPAGAEDAGYQPPQGEARFNKTSPEFVIARDGTILHAMGHLHDGGTNIELLVNGRLVCDSRATYGGSQGTFVNADGSKWETISSMSNCRDPIRVKKGDVMSMISRYDTKLHPLRETVDGHMMEEMGIYTLFFATK